MYNLKVQVQTHCSGANFGPGFDNAAGAFRDLFLTASAELASHSGLEIEFTGKYKFPTTEGKSRPRKVYNAMVNDFRLPNIGLKFYFRNDIKDGGLGTSAANCVQAAELMNYFFNLGLTREQIAHYAAKGEPGHEDNTNASVFGGVVFTKVYRESGPWEFEPHPIPQGIVPALVIPLTINKEGGTEQARADLETTKEKNLSPAEIDLRNQMYLELVRGFDNDDFGTVREAIRRYSAWDKSVTFVRNKNGIYKMNVTHINSNLEAIVGDSVIVTPNGAGPVMLVLAKDPDAAARGVDAVVKEYEDKGHIVDHIVTSFEDSHSRIIP